MAEALLDTTDLVVLSLVLAALVYVGLKKAFFGEAADEPAAAASNSKIDVDEGDFVSKMAATEKTMVVFFGSQTGTSEDYASRLVKDARSYGIKAMAADFEDYEMERLEDLSSEVDGALAVFCMATYGEGDPTDNAQEFWNILKSKEEEGKDAWDLKGLNYAVFGLGNSTYEFYNTVGKVVDARLEESNATRMVELGLGDDDGNLEDDYMNWSETFWAGVCEHYGIDPESIDLSSQRQYEMAPVADSGDGRVFTGEPELLGSFKRQKKHFTPRNPYLAPIAVKEEMFKSEDRSCIHVELDITGSGIRYTTGDHVGIYPANNADEVESLGNRLGIDLDEVFSLRATDESARKQSPFPCPCTYRTALTYYVDIMSLPKTHIIREFSSNASDPAEKDALAHMASKEGKKEYGTFVIRDHRTVDQILGHFASVECPVDLLLELLPRLQARFYSISSSSKKYPNSIHVTAAVVRFQTKLGVDIDGVCTTWLDTMTAEASKVPVFVRTASFRLPPKSTTPVIMVGPGTGVAPFRGFVQERAVLAAKGKTVGDTMLFFGCQKKAEHFLYQKELEEFGSTDYGTLKVAFSRDDPSKKVYVQHLLEESGTEVYKMLKNGGHLYVCGDAKYMARDVNHTLVRVAEQEGGLTNQQAVNWVKDLRMRKRYSEDVWA